MDITDERPMLRTVKICRNCRHFAAYVYENVADGIADQLTSDYGECRRFPPVIIEMEESNFPVVEENTWCGEFDF
jgi:hypothetical protein